MSGSSKNESDKSLSGSPRGSSQSSKKPSFPPLKGNDKKDNDKNKSSGDGEQFAFYYKFAKALVLKLVDSKECALGAQWLKLFAANNESKGAVVGVKLLILSLNRGFLSSPFDEAPPNDVSMFERDDMDEMQMAYLFLSVGKSESSETNANPPITTTLSSDFSQYTAVQEIPRFGIHCYFATSSDPIDKWRLPPGRMVMPGDVGNTLAWEKCMAKISTCLNLSNIGNSGSSKCRPKCNDSTH